MDQCGRLLLARCNRENLDDAHDLRAGVLELVVREVDPVDLRLFEIGDHAGRRFACGRERRLAVDRRDVEARDPRVAPREVLVRLATDDPQRDFIRLAELVRREPLHRTDHVRVERAGETTIRRHDDDGRVAQLALLEQRVRILAGHPRELRDHRGQRGRIRASGDDRVLRAAQLGSGDELERTRDLPRVLHADDPLAD